MATSKGHKMLGKALKPRTKKRNIVTDAVTAVGNGIKGAVNNAKAGFAANKAFIQKQGGLQKVLSGNPLSLKGTYRKAPKKRK